MKRTGNKGYDQVPFCVTLTYAHNFDEQFRHYCMYRTMIQQSKIYPTGKLLFKLTKHEL